MMVEKNVIEENKSLQSAQRNLGWLKKCYGRMTEWTAISFLLFPVYVVFVMVIICFVLGLMCLSALKKHRGRLSDNGFVVPGIAVSAIIFLALPFVLNQILLPLSLDRDDVNYIGYAFRAYEKEHETYLSNGENWNEVIDGYLYERFRSDNNVNLENYALNSEALRADIKVPAKLVLLFPVETPGKDLVGGSEMFKRKGGRYSVLCVDNSILRCSAGDVDKLKWKATDPVYKPDRSVVIISLVSMGLVFSLIILYCYRSVLKKHKTALVLVAVLSVITGSLMGKLSEWYFYISRFRGTLLDLDSGIYIGAAFGLLVAVGFTGMLLKKVYAISGKYESNYGYITMYGALAGLVAAVLVHLSLIVCYGEYDWLNICYGAGFGVYTGIVLAMICQRLFKVREPQL